MTNAKQILTNISSNQVIFFLNIGVVFFLTPFVIETLGKKYYGAWILINTVLGYFSILEFGIRPALSRFVAKYRALGDIKKLESSISTAFFLLCITSIFCLIATLGISLFINHIFELEGASIHLVRLTVATVGIGFAIAIPLQIFGSALAGMERFDLINIGNFIELVFRTGLIVYFLNNNGNIWHIAFSTVFISILRNFLDIYFVKKQIRYIRVAISRFEKKFVMELLGYGIFSVIINISLVLIYQTDISIIGIFLGTSYVAVYSIPGTLVEYSRMMIEQCTRIFTPVMTRSFYSDSKEKLIEIYFEATYYIASFSILIIVGILLLGKEFILLWVGKDFISGIPVLYLLMIPQVVGLSQQISSQVLFGVNKINSLAVIEACSAVMNLVLSLILVKSFGLKGVALGTAIPLLITHTIILPVYTCRYLKVNFFSYLKKCYLKNLCLFACLSSLAVVKRHYLIIDSWPVFAATAAFITLLWGILFVTFLLKSEHKKVMLRKIKTMYTP
ncbi:MAG: oligosaccharide flippase family protein [Proteobacteria bacterium]|nr:oligosaccharide flippase family protein [Desulfobacula sp.]MBU4130419.1 oligosaccharide flippase family protein [Pseudomonadota bacterium]